MIKDWQDPQVLFMSARAFILVTHTIFGIYLWEFLQSLNFDWQFVTRRRPLKAASIIYLLARYMMLVALIVGVRICNALSPDINCQRWNYILHACAYTCVAFTSLLLYIRVVALSARNMFVVVGLGIFYATYWAFVVYGVYHSEAVYVPELFLCAAVKLTAHRLNTIVQFSFDFTCLCVMTFFLLRMHHHDSGRHGGSLWKFLIQQDIVYFACITSAYLFASVFLIINLNDAVSQAPNVFALLITSVCATRMQRGLVQFNEPRGPYIITTGTTIPQSPIGARFVRRPTSGTDPSGVHVTVDIEEKGDAYAMSKIEAESARDLDDSKDELSVRSAGRDLGQV